MPLSRLDARDMLAGASKMRRPIFGGKHVDAESDQARMLRLMDVMSVQVGETHVKVAQLAHDVAIFKDDVTVLKDDVA